MTAAPSPAAARVPRRLALVPPAAPGQDAAVPTPAEAAAWLRRLLAGGLADNLDGTADPALASLLAEAADLAGESLSWQTLRVYGGAWARWARWCSDNRLAPLPARPDAVAAYVASLYGGDRPLRPSTVAVHITAINTAHRLSEHPEPARTGPARAVQNGARRRHGTAPLAAKDALVLSELRPVLLAALIDPARRTSRAALALRACGARPSQIAALRWEDARPSRDGGWEFRPAPAAPAARRPVRVRPTGGPSCPAAALAAARPASGSGPLCAAPAGGPMGRAGLVKMLRRVCAEAGEPLPDRGAPPAAAARRVLAALPVTGPAQARDHAMLLVGFVGALRRSSLAALRWGDLATEADGDVRVLVRSQKNDPDGAGHTFWLAPGSDPLTCPVAAVATWRAALTRELGRAPQPQDPFLCRIDRTGRIATGPGGMPVPVAPNAVAEAITRACTSAGHSPGRFGSHSLRSGMVTEAAGTEGVTPIDIQTATGHKSAESVMRYVRAVHARRRHPARRMAL